MYKQQMSTKFNKLIKMIIWVRQKEVCCHPQNFIQSTNLTLIHLFAPTINEDD